MSIIASLLALSSPSPYHSKPDAMASSSDKRERSRSREDKRYCAESLKNHLDPVSARLTRAALETVLLLSRDAELEKTRLDLERARMTAEDFRSGGGPASGLLLQSLRPAQPREIDKCQFTVHQWIEQITSNAYNMFRVATSGPSRAFERRIL